MKDHIVTPRACPRCGKVMDRAVNLEGRGAPRDGDISICPYCRAVSQFSGRLFTELTEEEFKALPPETMGVIIKVLGKLAKEDPKVAAAYKRRIEEMASRARAWRASNPNADAQVRFNYPPDVTVIMTMKQAMEKKFVTVNDAGAEMLKAMGLGVEAGEATIYMVSAALDLSNKPSQGA